MANGEWLTQLMAGLGGAFTGATQAKSRMAEEAEAERKRMELENERARLNRIQQLRGGGFSEASARELLSLGETPGNVESLRELFTPKAKPTYEERKEQGGTAIYKDGQFSGWKYKPPTERETPSGPTPADIRSARSELRGAEAGFRSVLGSRPRQSQYIDPLTRLPDTTAFQRAEQSWRPESTYAAERRQTAGEELQALLRATGGARVSKADRWEQLVRDGMKPEDATRQVNREYQ